MSNPITTVLPESSPGLVNYRRETGGADQYGTVYTIHSIITICYEWNKRHPDRPMSWGDISRKDGGSFLPEHKSHRKGVDADGRPPNNLEPYQNVPTTIDDKHYSQKLTREFIVLARSLAKFSIILFNDPALVKLGLCTAYPDHRNHIHFRFKNISMELKPSLKRGDHGADVLILQDALLRLGYLKKHELTLQYDEATEKAVRSLQAKHALVVDGKKGKFTQAAIDADLKGLK